MLSRIKSLLLLLLIFSAPCISFAQIDVSITMEEWNTTQTSQKTSIDSLRLIIDTLNTANQTKDMKIVELQRQDSTYQSTAKNIRDSLINRNLNINYLCDSISALNRDIIVFHNELNSLKRQIAFADTCIARLANRCLYEKFGANNVSEALKRFDRIYSVELKQTFSPLKNLLQCYSTHYNSILEILKEVQQDQDMKNPFNGEACAQGYVSKLKSTDYYKDVYNADWIIPYLNEIIDKSIDKLNLHNVLEKKFADFKDILDE